MAWFVIVLRIFLAFECCCFAYVYAEYNNDTVDCVYHGDMCEIDKDRCLIDCLGHGMCELFCEYMGYPVLYKGRGDVDFWVNISNFEYYKEDVAITVLRYENQVSTVVQDCCNLKPGEKCTLPAFGDFEYHLYAPTSGDGWYCTRPIEGRWGFHPKWCDEDPNPTCLNIITGVIGADENFTDISFDAFPLQLYETDYCLFNVPNEYASRGKVTQNGLTRDVEGIFIEGNTIHVDDFKTECILIEKKFSFNVSHHLLSPNNTKSGFTRCLFFRMDTFDPDWRPKPICVTVDSSNTQRNWSTIVIAIVAAVVFTALLIVSACVCTKYLKFFIPSYEDSIRDGIMGKIVEDDDKFFMNVDASERVVGKKSHKEKSNSKEKLVVRYVTMSANNMSSNDVLENVCAIVPTVSLKIEKECLGEQSVLDGDVVKPPVEENIPKSSVEELVPTCICPLIIDGYSRKDDPALSSNIRHDLEASMSPDQCGKNLSSAMYTPDENGNDTETFTISSEDATKDVAMLPKDDNFDYIAKSSQCLVVIHEHQCATSSPMEWACVETVS